MQAPTFLSKPTKPDNAQRKQQNWPQHQRKTVIKKTVRKEVGCFIVQRRGVSSPSSNIRLFDCLTVHLIRVSRGD